MNEWINEWMDKIKAKVFNFLLNFITREAKWLCNVLVALDFRQSYYNFHGVLLLWDDDD